MKSNVAFKIGISGIVIALSLGLFSIIQVSSINSDQNIYGLGDAMSLSCDQIDTLGEVLDFSPTGNCSDNPEELARTDKYEKKSIYIGIGVFGGILAIISMLILLYSKRNKLENVNPTVSNQLVDHKSAEDSLGNKLLQIEELYKKGLLTEKEYFEKRSKFLEEL